MAISLSYTTPSSSCHQGGTSPAVLGLTDTSSLLLHTPARGATQVASHQLSVQLTPPFLFARRSGCGLAPGGQRTVPCTRRCCAAPPSPRSPPPSPSATRCSAPVRPYSLAIRTHQTNHCTQQHLPARCLSRAGLHARWPCSSWSSRGGECVCESGAEVWCRCSGVGGGGSWAGAWWASWSETIVWRCLVFSVRSSPSASNLISIRNP